MGRKSERIKGVEGGCGGGGGKDGHVRIQRGVVM